MSQPPRSLAQLRQDLKAALAAEPQADRRAELGRALKAIERCAARPLDSAPPKA